MMRQSKRLRRSWHLIRSTINLALNGLRRHGVRGVIKRLPRYFMNRRIVLSLITTGAPTNFMAGGSIRSLILAHNEPWAPLPVYIDRRAPRTLTIVTDSVAAHSLFGGVGTALVVGALSAKRLGARLRLVTRSDATDPAVLGRILKAHKIDWDGETDFAHIPIGRDKPLSVGPEDTILTTSWWTTRAVLGSVDAAQILYLLQEDERMFYAHDDSRLRCAETLAEPNVRVIVNTQLLFDHLAEGADPLPRLRERGHWFDPAFPSFAQPTESRPRDGNGKWNFFFYARPNHPRNLFWRGLEVIDAAMRDGSLPSNEWNIHFVGNNIPDIKLPGDARPIVRANLSWSNYAELVSQMDLGLCLMDTPHPSYPPLDLAASGAVVVTNTHGPKTSLERWSRNIITAPPSIDGLCEALRRGAMLAQNAPLRMENYRSDHISRDWEASLRPALDRLLPSRELRKCS